MLASVPQMDPVRSLSRNPDVVTRHPSAEDLDAAQQLISSAQAGREHTVDRHRDENGIAHRGFEGQAGSDRYGMDTSANGSMTHWSESQKNALPEIEKTSPKSQKDTSFLGHSCRLVYLYCFIDSQNLSPLD